MCGTATEPVKITPPGSSHFFGYYDKTPWDESGRYILALQTPLHDSPPGPYDAATIGLIDTRDGLRWRSVAQTRCWNWQQGNMLQWLAGGADRPIVYNARQGDRPVGVVMDPFTQADRLLPRPIYAISPEGRTAISLNFARLADTRPGYGYYGLDDPHADEPHPAGDGLFRMDLSSGECNLILSLADLACFRPLPSMRGARHWVNHVQFNTDGSRFGVLHRWQGPNTGRRHHTRLLAADPDGEGLCCLADHEMVSHYDWQAADRVLAWARMPGGGDGFYLLEDRTGRAERFAPDALTHNGHCSFSPDRRWLLTDTYPLADQKRELILYHPGRGERLSLGRFHSPPELEGQVRCDLHPRWSPDGRRVCFDSAHEGRRQMYVLHVGALVG